MIPVHPGFAATADKVFAGCSRKGPDRSPNPQLLQRPRFRILVEVQHICHRFCRSKSLASARTLARMGIFARPARAGPLHPVADA